MSYSLSEIEAMCLKATRGAGYDWGLAEEAGMAARLQSVAEALGCGFLAAGDHAEVSPVDGVHLDIKAHHALGEAAARAVVGFWES